ncbi:hypothetical protein [Cronobacter malonaticus]|uniref:hypothetical protein n=1 Tax=Cronobacter malonaticus TaxID=413503 RepID=UPI000CFBE94A|nr:hypothetical protein [Cronobacter malonaticus]
MIKPDNDLEKKRNMITLYSVRIEELLRANGGTGKGLSKLVKSLYNNLDHATRRNIGNMSELRNRAVHYEHFECSDRDIAKFEAEFKSVNHALINMLEAKKQNAETIASLKVTMAANSGIKKVMYGVGIGALLLAAGFAVKSRL